jgi:hypothetical protein
MLAATYVTIWTALTLFALGEVGRTASRPWARRVSAAGLTLALVHTLLAFDVFHAWSHADAVQSTATQTGEVFGVRFGAGVFVNYLFFAVWLADLVTWRRTRPSWLTWLSRAFYMLIVFNGAVVFAAGWRRLMGLVVVFVLLGAWLPGQRSRA